jgi:amidase
MTMSPIEPPSGPPSASPTASLVAIVELLERREVSARELLAAQLDRIDRLDGDVNAVVTIRPDEALAHASAIDEARANGATLGPLAGVATTIKDAIATAGMRSTGGAVELADHIPLEDATVVERLRAAGVIVVGKTNVPRWSSDYQTYNEMFGTTANPWDLTRTPGGSSGGPAAAVAMGFTPFEIGTDIGGSIRVPSSFCGIVGHKPSFGIIPTYGYLDNPVSHRNVADVNVFGPMTRTVDDAELLLGLLAGPSPDDAPAWTLALPPPRATALDELRVVAWLDDPFNPVEPEVADVLTAAVVALERAGTRIDHERRPAIDPAVASAEGLRLISAATAISDDEDEYASALAAGHELHHRQWDVLHRRRGEVRRRWNEFFADVDVLLCPVIAVPPFRHVHHDSGENWLHVTLPEYGDRHYSSLIGWSALIGSAYLPATVVPVGVTADGLPVGIQIVAPYLHDRTALAAARCVESVLGGYRPPPLAAR